MLPIAQVRCRNLDRAVECVGRRVRSFAGSPGTRLIMPGKSKTG